MRVIVRRRKLFEREQPTLFDTNGYRYSCFVTNTPDTGHKPYRCNALMPATASTPASRTA
jgi:hypothetical protein